MTALPARMNTLTAQVKAVMPAVMTVSLVALFLGTAFGSLVMSANGTMTFAVNHHMPPAIQWAPVLVLELSQVAGTMWWLTSDGWSRLGAVVMVAGIATATACLSQVLYGWALALFASVLMVATLHAIACIARRYQSVTPGHDLVVDQQVPRLDGWTKVRARDRARELGVSQAGTVGEIVARIEQAEAVAA